MFGMGFSELVVIAVVALIFVGPKRLPEVMKQAGKLFVHVRRTANDVKSSFDQVVREAEDDIRKQEAEQMRQLMSGAAKPATTAQAIDAGVVGTQAMVDHPLESPHHAVTAVEPASAVSPEPAAAPQPAAAPATEPPKGQV